MKTETRKLRSPQLELSRAIQLGPGRARSSLRVPRAVYVLVGAPALWQLVPLSKAFSSDEASALRGAFNLLKTGKYPAAMT